LAGTGFTARRAVRYLFSMDDSITTTAAVTRWYASLKISCTQCGHQLVAGPDKVAEMFPRMMKLDKVRYRLRCRACGGRMPQVEVLRKVKRPCGDLS
jgi:hypothetical protein